MKVSTFFFGLLLFLSSCNKDFDKSIYQDYQGLWVLVKISGNTPDSETTGQEMGWQESYKFNNDGTFSKSREQNGTVTESAGTYSAVKSEEGKRLELTFASKSDIIGSCLGDQKEVLLLQSSTVMTSTWNQCDGPGLEYEKGMKID